MDFAAAEAYKLLRTNVMFSFPDANGSKIIGITSASPGEGKSLTAINLAYTFAETGKNILLIEGDMRRPTMAKRLALASKPGFSNVLVGTDSAAAAVQEYAMRENGRRVSFDVLVSGNIPPNPSELLGASHTAAFFKKAKDLYDFIILDLPPVTAVTDAIVASHLVDGVIMVVRANQSERGVLSDAMRELSLADAHVLGFVFNGAGIGEKRYRRKYY